MEKFEQEPKPNSREELVNELRGKGCIINKVETKIDEAPETCFFDKDCFNDAEWFIEGELCCPQHADKFLQILKESQEGTEQRMRNREGIFKNLKN